LLPFLLAGCFHKTNQNPVQPLAPPIEDTPPPKPASAPTNLPPPVVTVPPPAPEPTVQTEPPPPPVKHKKPKPTQQASVESPGVSAIGQLSSGDPSQMRNETEASLAAIDRGLNGITRTLSDQEQKTASQIREFLKEAHTALASGDVDGAHTLAAKAKVLLGELSQ
jgi:outer membrane biosynthesis protein TonB